MMLIWPPNLTYLEMEVRRYKLKYNMGLWEQIYWKVMTGKEINVRWPAGWVEGRMFESSDPNEHYRPWLESNVGKQGKDWQWKPGQHNDLYITLSRRKMHLATMILLKWS